MGTCKADQAEMVKMIAVKMIGMQASVFELEEAKRKLGLLGGERGACGCPFHLRYSFFFSLSGRIDYFALCTLER